jgi:glutathione synthase/RimK-type ligase-like ATP-grasp enzyme
LANILLTLAEEVGATTEKHFAVRFPVDENDCFDFAAGLKAIGHDVYFVNWRDLDLENEPDPKKVQFNRMFDYQNSRFVKPLELSDFALVFVYKMEGFYFDLSRFFKMVSTFEKSIPIVVNHPSTIRHNIDKSYLFQLQESGVSVGSSYTIEEAVEQRLKHNQPCVIKPLFGERGNSVFLAKTVADLESLENKEKFIAQEFMPEIRQGEKSLAFLGFDFQHAVKKRPNKENADEFRCNESLGGTVDIYEPTEEELDYCDNLLRVYESFGCPIHFSRIDFVTTDDGPKLVEAELLNPSIYANYSNKGPQFGKAIAAYFDALMRNAAIQESAYSRAVDAR